MRKGRDGGENEIKKNEKENTGVFSGHYVIASSLPPERRRPNDDARTTTPERRPLERRVLVPILKWSYLIVQLYGY